MKKLTFPAAFVHEHPPVRNTNEVFAERSGTGQRIADRIATIVGSWKFIVIQSLILAAWITLNVIAYIRHWDEYPFILMNLLLSMQSAYAAPIILMSQNRQAMRDRIVAQHDFIINEKAEVEIRAILDHLAAQDRALSEIYGLLAAGPRRQSAGES